MTTTVWNLVELSELENRVLTPFEGTRSKARANKKATMKGIIATVAAATALTICGGQGNAASFSSPLVSTAIVQSGYEQRPPLENLFAKRFDGGWSKETEDGLLSNLEARRKAPAKAELEEQAVESIFFNQQEDVSEDVTRLSKSEIAKILKERKLV